MVYTYNGTGFIVFFNWVAQFLAEIGIGYVAEIGSIYFTANSFPLLLWILIYQSVYLILHYLYDWFPGIITRIISGIDESVYQHMKIGFFSAIIIFIIEYIIMRKHIEFKEHFIYSRIFLCVFLPLAIFVVYLLGPLIFIKIESILGEIIFANIALLASSFSSIVISRHIEKTQPELHFRIVLIFLFISSLVQYMVFTNRLPWFDIFQVPPGW